MYEKGIALDLPRDKARNYCKANGLDECRRLWVKNHSSLYKHECMFCGKEFESQTKEQKFCNHDCYIRNRFWRQEDTEEIMKLILAGKKVPMVPKWLKDILNGETK